MDGRSTTVESGLTHYKAVKFNTQNIGEEISYEYNGVIKKSPEVDLKLARIGPDFPMNSREAFLIQPMGSSQGYRTLSMRMRVEWTQDQYNNGNPPRSFTRFWFKRTICKVYGHDQKYTVIL